MKLVDLSIRRPVAVTMTFIAVMVFGVVSFTRLPLDLLPDLSFPTLTIQVDYAGVAPQEMETLVSRPLEEAISVVQGVQQITSRSRAGQSDVTVQFRWGTDMDFAALDVRERLDLINLPQQASRPTIARFDPAMDPVLRFALSPSRPLDSTNPVDRDELMSLRVLAEEQIRRGLEGIEGVAAVRITGGLEEEIQVDVDEGRLAALGIPFQQVAQRLQAENINLSGGILEESDAEYVVRTVNEFEDVEELFDIVIGAANGQPVLLRDVATVRRSAQERETISRVNGAEAVELAILRESTSNIVQVADMVRQRIQLLESELPEGVTFTLVSDQASFIRQAVRDVQQSAIFGGILAVLVLLLFLRHLPTTLIVATAIPISVVATFVLMFSRDITLNIMSLGGLALGVGMLVDSAIVVLESIAREREAGAEIMDAARRGTDRVAKAVVASTLTTVAVFLPIIFVQGIAGQLFGDQAWTVSFALLSALVVSLTLIPMLAARAGRGARLPGGAPIQEKAPGGVGTALAAGTGLGIRGGTAALRGTARFLSPITSGFEGSYGWLERRYPIWLRALLRKPIWVMCGAGLALLTIIPLVSGTGIELIPELRQGELVVELEAAPGTSLASMEELTVRAERMALAIPDVSEVFSSVGIRGIAGAMGSSGDQERNVSTLLVRLDDLYVDDGPVVTALSANLSALPGIAFRIDRPKFFSMAAPIEVEVRGYNLGTLREIAADVRTRLRSLPEIGEVEDDRREGNPEVTIQFDRERVARAGLTIGDAAEAVRARVRGEDATEFMEGDREINILVRAQENQRQTLQDLGDLRIETPLGGSLPLSAIATLGFGEGPSEIVRRSGSRVTLVEARPAGQDLAGTITRVEEEMLNIPVPRDFHILVAGQSRELRDSIRSMQLALLLAVFLVYLVMASQFESFRLPLVILVAVPLAIPGALGSLWITSTPLSVVALIGMVMLTGIVVNNAIVFVDYANQLRRELGYALNAALLETGRVRLRPILMSTITTVLGLLPMALIPGEGSELRVPLAVPVIGGLVVSTVLTLVVVPVLYRMAEVRGEERALAAAPQRLPQLDLRPATGD